MSGHGPDAATFEQATKAKLEPKYLDDTLAFMFESRLIIHPTRFALETPALQSDYWQCWHGLKKHFKPE
jgi:homogentisate 1,2-dioxygenase